VKGAAKNLTASPIPIPYPNSFNESPITKNTFYRASAPRNNNSRFRHVIIYVDRPHWWPKLYALVSAQAPNPLTWQMGFFFFHAHVCISRLNNWSNKWVRLVNFDLWPAASVCNARQNIRTIRWLPNKGCCSTGYWCNNRPLTPMTFNPSKLSRNR
jgi:hypothetical protein